MQIHDLIETELHQLSEREQEVVVGGERVDASNYQQFLTNLFTGLANKPDGLYNHFDYNGFFKSLEQYGFYGPDSSAPGGSKSTVPGATNWKG